MAIVTKELIDQLNIIGVTPSGRIKTITGYMELNELRIKLFDLGVAIPLSQTKDLLKEVKQLSANRVDKFSLEGLDTEGIDSLINSLVPLVSIESGSILFYDEQTRLITNLSEEWYRSKKGLNKNEMMLASVPGIVGFYPLNPEPIFESEFNRRTLTHFNIYNTPKWLSIQATDSSRCPERIWTLLNNVFPDPESLEYTLNWLYWAYMERNQVYLCMVGPRGVGKTMVADLAGQLVGTHYYQKADDSMLDDKFNSQLENARIIFYDEISVNDPEKINKLKRFANETTALQAKGKDTKTIRNYSSGILANNYIDGLQIGPEERRFSIVKIGSKDLREVMSQEDINILAEYLNRPNELEPHEDIVNFGHWLVNKYGEHNPPKYSNSHVMRGDYFEMIAFNGLSQWKQFIITTFKENPTSKPIFLKELKKDFKTFVGDDKQQFPQPKTISNFIYDYRYKGKYKMGEVTKKYDDRYNLSPAIVLDEKFREVIIEELKAEGIEWKEKEMEGMDSPVVEETDDSISEDQIEYALENGLNPEELL